MKGEKLMNSGDYIKNYNSHFNLKYRYFQSVLQKCCPILTKDIKKRLNNLNEDCSNFEDKIQELGEKIEYIKSLTKTNTRSEV